MRLDLDATCNLWGSYPFSHSYKFDNQSEFIMHMKRWVDLSFCACRKKFSRFNAIKKNTVLAKAYASKQLTLAK